MIRRTLKSLTYRGWRKIIGQTEGRILLACFPKSGSTFTSNVISELHGMKKVSLVPYYGRREQEICKLSLQEIAPNQKIIAQHHVRYHPHTQRLSAEYSLSNVVLTRNIFDAMVSIRDHIRNESEISPHAYLSESHKNLSNDDLDSLLADLVAPWYFNFFVSWLDCSNMLHITYEDLKENEIEYFMEILHFAKLNFSVEAVKDAINITKGKRSSRYNKGVQGRGNSLSNYAKDRITKLSQHYPDIDFKSIGIERG